MSGQSKVVYVPRDSSALSLGAEEVADAIAREAGNRGVNIRLIRNGSRGLYMVVAALAENLPHRSREHEFTDGRVYGVKDGDVLYGFGRVERVARER